MKRWYTLAVMAALATSARAQGPGGPGSMGQRPQLPDHWMTLDSLVSALGITAAQKPKIAGPYTALNAVLKQAADKRAAMRQRMGGQGGPGAPGGMQEMTEEQRQAMRARMDSMRTELQPLQEEAEMYLGGIRMELTPEQQTKFDALPKPVVVPQRRR